MDSGRIQKLLMTDEYADFEDAITVESVFIELDKTGEPLRQVFLGLTRDSLLLATESILNYKKCPWVIYDADVDVNTEWMELEWIVPICFLDITQVPDVNEHVLKVEFATKKHSYFLLSNIGGKENQKWKKWAQKIKDINDDPYGHLKDLHNQFTIPFELYDTGSGFHDHKARHGFHDHKSRQRRQSKAFDKLKKGGVTSTVQQYDRSRRRHALVDITFGGADNTENNGSDLNLPPKGVNRGALLDIPKLHAAFSNLQTAISKSFMKPDMKDESSQTKIKSTALSNRDLAKVVISTDNFGNKKSKKKYKFGFLKLCRKKS